MDEQFFLKCQAVKKLVLEMVVKNPKVIVVKPSTVSMETARQFNYRQLAYMYDPVIPIRPIWLYMYDKTAF